MREFRHGLESLTSILPPSVQAEVIFVVPLADLSLQSEIAAIQESSGKVICIPSAWGNRNTQRNDGMRAATGNWVYFLDSDVRIGVSQRLNLALRLQSLHLLQQDIAVVSGPYQIPEIGYWGRSYSWLSNRWLENSQSGLRCLAGNTLINKNLLVKRGLSLAYAPFNAQLLQGGEEIHLATRLRAAGLRGIIDSELKVEHHCESTFRHFWQRTIEHEGARRQAQKIERGPRMSLSLVLALARSPHYWPALLVNAFGKFLAPLLEQGNLRHLGQRLPGPTLRALTRLRVWFSPHYWSECFRQKNWISVSRYLHFSRLQTLLNPDLLRGPHWTPLPDSLEWSVIVPCSGSVDYLRCVLQGLLAQKLNPHSYEILVIDDGCQVPLSEQLGTEFADSRVKINWSRIERRPDRAVHGAARARNQGIRLCRGKNILFLDSDMVVSPEQLSEFTRALETADVVQGRRVFLNGHGSERVIDRHVPQANEIQTDNYYWRKFYRLRDWNMSPAPWKYVCTHSLAVKREWLEKTGIFRPEFNTYGFEDCELGYRLFCQGARFHQLKMPIYHLYPKGRSLKLHLTPDLRWDEMKKSARIFADFYSDPSVTFELQGYFGWKNVKAQAASSATSDRPN